jgi:hypothetical protein
MQQSIRVKRQMERVQQRISAAHSYSELRIGTPRKASWNSKHFYPKINHARPGEPVSYPFEHEKKLRSRADGPAMSNSQTSLHENAHLITHVDTNSISFSATGHPKRYVCRRSVEPKKPHHQSFLGCLRHQPNSRPRQNRPFFAFFLTTHSRHCVHTVIFAPNSADSVDHHVPAWVGAFSSHYSRSRHYKSAALSLCTIPEFSTYVTDILNSRIHARSSPARVFACF